MKQREVLEKAAAEIRGEQVERSVIDAAAARVWERISAPREKQTGPAPIRIRGCADFQALIPSYLDRTLPEARKLLLEDHTRECVACRHAVEAARSGDVQSIGPRPARRAPMRPEWKWAIAAALTIGTGLGIFAFRDEILPVPGGSRAVVRNVAGFVYRVSDNGGTGLPAGAVLRDREGVRTAKGSGAILRLADGSLVEMRERSELAVSRKWSGTTIQLRRGSVIVQAARQRSGHLYVATRDCLVSVKGTVFSVNAGVKGSRVSVIEGEVHVEQGRQTKVLHSGDQTATSAQLEPVSIRDEVSWSRDSNRYFALLGEFSAIQKQLESSPGAPLRYSSKLLPYVPDGAVVYVAIPNPGSRLAEAWNLIQQRMQESEALRQWWNQHQAGAGPEEILQKVRAFSDYLGDEIVLALAPGKSGGMDAMLMAEVTRPDLMTYLRQFHQPNEILMSAENNIFVATTRASWLNPAPGNFSHGALYARIREAYGKGVSWLCAADMEQILAQSVHKEQAMSGLGIGDVKTLVFERKDLAGKTDNRAQIEFGQVRRGVASWLAAPAPMGALDYISPDAALTASFVVKSPKSMVEDLLQLDPQVSASLAEFEARTGVNVLSDLAGPLGGDAAIALDGPVLPMPSWKVVVEVYDPARLESTIEKLVAAWNQEKPAAPIHLDQEQSGGRTFYHIRGDRALFQAEYTFSDGYLIAAPTRELLMRALQNRQTGYTLAHAPGFRSLLPNDPYPNCSAVVYQNLGPVIGPIASQFPSLSTLAASTAPTLVCAYGEPQRITVAGTGNLPVLNLAAMGGIFGQLTHRP